VVGRNHSFSGWGSSLAEDWNIITNRSVMLWAYGNQKRDSGMKNDAVVNRSKLSQAVPQFYNQLVEKKESFSLSFFLRNFSLSFLGVRKNHKKAKRVTEAAYRQAWAWASWRTVGAGKRKWKGGKRKAAVFLARSSFRNNVSFV
jgi:hypothetical protein